MTSKYSVIQYVPNPIADERINIGVLAFDDDDQVQVQFLQSWERVRNFSNTDISFLQDFAQRMQDSAASGLIFPSDTLDKRPYDKRLTKLALGNINSIQFTEPCASLEDVDSLMDDITSTFLVERLIRKSPVRDRQAAARITTSKIRKASKKFFGNKSKNYLKHNLQGFTGNHDFDAVVANGRPYLAAHGISFEVGIPQSNLDSIYWRVGDVKKVSPDFPIAIVCLPPKIESKNYSHFSRSYDKTIKIFENMGADILNEERIEGWANEILANEILANTAI